MPHHITFTRLRLVEQPLLAAGAAFVAGVLLAGATDLPSAFALSLFILLWVTATVATWAKTRMAGLALIIAFAASGSAIEAIATAMIDRTRLKRQISGGVIAGERPMTIEGFVAQAPELAPDRILLEVEARRIEDQQVSRPATGRLQLIVLFEADLARNRFDGLRIEYGSHILVSCQVRPPIGYRNPGVVPLESILDQKGLDATTLVRGPEFIVSLEKDHGWRALSVLYRLRARAITILLQRLRQPASGLLVASMFGNHNFLDRRIAESFRAGGTFHLLVISGMHVALIAAAILFILSVAIRSRPFRFASAVTVIWAFTLMVGAESAVTRAAAMISIAVLGQLVFRRMISGNVLGASAILLLLWNPNSVYGSGFQLSFLTVLVMAIGTAPLYERLRAIGAWQPSEMTPYPPRCSPLIRTVMEVIFWDERAFRSEMHESRIRFRLETTFLARTPRPTGISWILRSSFATILTTVGIQLALLPVMVLYFHRVSLIAPLSNVIEAAMLSLLMLAGLILVSLHLLNHYLADAFGHAINFAGDVIAHYSQAIDARPHASFRTPDYGEYSMPIYGVCFGIAIVWSLLLSQWNPLSFELRRDRRMSRRASRMGMTVLGILSIVMVWLVAVHPLAPRIEKGRLTLTMLDVGQGDALLLTFPEGRLMLLDSGGRLRFGDASRVPTAVFIEDRPGIGEMAIAPYLWHLGVKRLDFIAATHSDADHIQGFIDIVPSFEIGRALRVPAVSRSDDPFPQSLIGRAEVETIRRGTRLEIDGVRLDVLAPFAEMANTRYSANDRSLVLKVRYGNIVFLLTGDIERRTEMMLLEAGDDLRADLLKVAHHGSRTSTTERFLNAVRPSMALISAGSPSPFGHPHPDIVSRLEKKGVRIFRTAACGATSISTDGFSLAHRTFVKCQ